MNPTLTRAPAAELPNGSAGRFRATGGEEPRFLFWAVNWEFYEGMLALIGDRHVRITYDRGRLELMSPSYRHESASKIIGRLVEALADELNLPIKGGKSTTFRRQDLDRGLEPDECYYIANVSRILGRTEIDLAIDPPPDLAIEVDITRSSLSRLAIYASLGVPEVWRFDGESFDVMVLQSDATYVPQKRSPNLPMLDLGGFRQFLLRSEATDDTSLVRQFRAWFRASLTPPAAGDPPPSVVK